MRKLFVFGLIAAACYAGGTTPALAHPHVWVTMTTKLVYDSGGSLTGVEHTWTFDDMYTTFALQGLESRTKGQFTPEELKPLAKVNIESLKEYAYFTYAKLNGKTQKNAFIDPVSYWLTYDPAKTELTLHFTLPFRAPWKAKDYVIEIYDPEFFIDFGFVEKKNAVELIGAPPQCTVATDKPHDGNFSSWMQRLDKSFATSEANAGMGMNFANKITVKCP